MKFNHVDDKIKHAQEKKKIEKIEKLSPLSRPRAETHPTTCTRVLPILLKGVTQHDNIYVGGERANDERRSGRALSTYSPPNGHADRPRPPSRITTATTTINSKQKMLHRNLSFHPERFLNTPLDRHSRRLSPPPPRPPPACAWAGVSSTQRPHGTGGVRLCPSPPKQHRQKERRGSQDTQLDPISHHLTERRRNKGVKSRTPDLTEATDDLNPTTPSFLRRQAGRQAGRRQECVENIP